jgi:hypothetical protein
MKNLKGSGRKWWWFNLRYNLVIGQEALRKTTKSPSRID